MGRKATLPAENHFRGPTDVPFEVIVADPAWTFGDQLRHGNRGAASKYTLMSLAGIKALVPNMVERGQISIADNAILFLWAVSSQPQEALDVIKAWGFKVKTQGIWVKTRASVRDPMLVVGNLSFGMGRYLRASHEEFYIATRGSGTSLIQSRSERSVLFAPRRDHSEKPEEFFAMVRRLMGDRPGLELFARGTRPGFTTWGDQAR